MKGFAAVAFGGALGASARYVVYLLAGHYLGGQFPYATVIVNVIGSFIMGVLIELMALKWSVTAEMRLFLTTGILGGFTTFSAFSLDAVVLFERGRLGLSIFYVAASVILSITALFLGLGLMRRVLAF
ncbi:MAG: fluoride efflux transporter CrcB [Gammaproteobacteria bacterium]